MEIIAKTSGDAYLVKITEKEIAHLIGYRFASEDECWGKIKIGAEINISGMFNRLYDLTQAADRLAGAKERLNFVSRLLDEVEPVLKLGESERAEDVS